MAKMALLYALDGSVTGFVYCSQDEDLARQTHPRLLECATGDPAVVAPFSYQVKDGKLTSTPPKDKDVKHG